MTSDINRALTVNYTLQHNIPEDILFTTVRIITPEGYIRADLSQPTNIQHYYHIKDH